MDTSPTLSLWEVRNETEFAVGGALTRDREGVEHWVVAVRARFAIASDGPRIAAQRPVRLAPQYVDADASELLSEADIAPFRPLTDVTVSGTAALPDAEPSYGFMAHLRVGAMRKAFAVHPERWIHRTGGGFRIERGGPFEQSSLSWREALGGPDPFADALRDREAACDANPIGKGWMSRWSQLPLRAQIAMPRLEDPERPVEAGLPMPAPHGPGSIQPHWETRRRHAGTYDATWRAERMPLAPLDFDERFHQAAPEDQRLALRGGEPFEALNLSPEGPIAFQIPQIVLEATTRIGTERLTHRLRLVAVALDTRERALDMVWNGAIPCNGRDMEVEGSRVRVRQMAGVLA